MCTRDCVRCFIHIVVRNLLRKCNRPWTGARLFTPVLPPHLEEPPLWRVCLPLKGWKTRYSLSRLPWTRKLAGGLGHLSGTLIQVWIKSWWPREGGTMKNLCYLNSYLWSRGIKKPRKGSSEGQSSSDQDKQLGELHTPRTGKLLLTSLDRVKKTTVSLNSDTLPAQHGLEPKALCNLKK